jgi:hypothetical protein
VLHAETEGCDRYPSESPSDKPSTSFNESNFQWKKSGYYIVLNHDFKPLQEDVETVRDSPGFHVYLHEPRERFTEHGILSSGRIEYLYLQANEEMELKLTAQHFHQFKGRGGSCSDDSFKSRSIVGFNFCGRKPRKLPAIIHKILLQSVTKSAVGISSKTKRHAADLG